MSREAQVLLELVSGHSEQIQSRWLQTATEMGARVTAADNAETLDLLVRIAASLRDGADPARFAGSGWQAVRDELEALSRSRAMRGWTAAETSAFVLALKRPLFEQSQEQFASDAASTASLVWMLSALADHMAAWTITMYQRNREEIIRRQQDELLELSTPVVKLWDGILAVPMIGSMDSARTQVVMETLLQRIADSDTRLAIIDITGVPTVDTLVAQQLLKTVSAIRLMGCECIISGIRPQIAQSVVHLGIDLSTVTTTTSLADALKLALRLLGFVTTRTDPATGSDGLRDRGEQAAPRWP